VGRPIRYGKITFESEFLFGTDAEGAALKFSRAERMLLTKFSQNAKAILTRDELLDAISGPGSDASDRNIDFVINRLRRKLKDSRTNPTYIATQYGEGYVWIAERVTQCTETSGAFLVVGPVSGMKFLGRHVEHARAYAEELKQQIDRQTARESRVVFDPDCPPAESFTGEKPQFTAELSFFSVNNRLDCVITLKSYAAGHIIRVSRHIVANGQPSDRSAIEATAAEIVEAIWHAFTVQASTLAAPTVEPLAVRMDHAASVLADAAPWQETMRRLALTLEQERDNHQAKLMMATCLHSKYLTSGPMILPQQDFRAQDEDEIERLVLSSLPHLQDNPVFKIAAGKLLYFIDRGHRPLAIEIVESAFNSSTAFATSFAVLGQIRMLEGDIEAALSLIDHGLELCRDGSKFELYLLVLKCEALLASGQRKALDGILETFYAKGPGTRAALSIFFTSAAPEEVGPEVHSLLENIDEQRAKAMLVYSNYVCARLFRFSEHRENILRGPLTLLVQRFGPGVVPDDLRLSVPALVSAFVRGKLASTRSNGNGAG
jgi:hypothetical protein